ncbi:MAG: transcriptional regulator [Gammaproteobacteria bacterium RIFCSPLOWO2_02_FULL_57_10]|nr:MAG: transcriptional regulator [Gammaproteobacteria bacterium RIFCSPLOWO2_02_FULL_57_10]
MPEISRFFGIVVRMYFDDHAPPHIHVEYQGQKAVFDFGGHILHGALRSRIAIRLVQEWIALHVDELHADWELAQNGRELNSINPLE